MHKIRFLSGNALKLIAAAAMVADHVGLIFFPQYIIFRIIGRLAFPIFAFFIAEGCRYTRNKLRYFLTMAIIALVCQVVYFVALGDTAMSVFVTFSVSILLVYSLQYCKKVLFDKESSRIFKIFTVLAFFALLIITYGVNRFVDMDYGFAGCIMPAFAAIFHSDESSPEFLKKLDCNTIHVLSTAISMVYMASVNRRIQYYSLLTVPLLLLYSGKRGKAKLKYFFYLFYPLHLVALYGIYMLIS